MKIINDIIDGKTNIEELMTHVHGRIKADRSEIRKALEGRLTDHHWIKISNYQEDPIRTCNSVIFFYFLNPMLDVGLRINY